jgi:hypothetical protein
MAYETTNVAVEKSQSEIRKLLLIFGAGEFQFGEGTGIDQRRWAGVSFRHDGHTVMMQAPLKDPDEAERKRIDNTVQRARSRSRAAIEAEYWEQEERRIWRVLFWSLKSRMIAVEEGVEEFEQAFLAHLVDPRTGVTLWQHVQPAIEQGHFRLGGSGMKSLDLPTSDIEEVEVIE